MTYNIIIKAHEYYQCGASLSKTANKFGTTRQRLHSYFKRLNLWTRPLKRLPQVSYKGDNYAKSGKCGFYRKTKGDRRMLHHQIYIDNYGEIPLLHAVIFKDGNKENMEPTNLKLESYPEVSSKQINNQNQHTIKKKDHNRRSV